MSVSLAEADAQRAPLKFGAVLPTLGDEPMSSAAATRTAAPVLERLDDAIAALGDLPVLDRTVQRIRQLAEDPEATTHELVATLESDPALAANVLRFANSAHCAVVVRASTLRQAVTLIGRANVGRLALEAAVCRFFERAPGNGRASRGALHVHASQVAACAMALAKRSGADTEAAHLGGLLHDLGKLVLPLAFGEEALDALSLAHPAGAARAAAERDQLGADHALAGQLFAERAGLEESVALIIGAHHGGADGTIIPSAEAACVQAADCIVRLAAGLDAEADILEAALERLGLGFDILDEVAGKLMGGPEGGSDGSLADRVASLEREARADELTGVLNRRYWTSAVREKLDAGVTGAVVICDVDHFKAVNDDHGHLTGDLVLSEVARVLSRHGLAGRLGGDEFVLFTELRSAAALTACEAILREVRGAFATASSPAVVDVAVSIGLAEVPEAAADLSVIMRAADDALYEAKRAGRGRVAVAPGH